MKCSNMLHLTSTAHQILHAVWTRFKAELLEISSPNLVFSGPQTGEQEHLVLGHRETVFCPDWLLTFEIRCFSRQHFSFLLSVYARLNFFSGCRSDCVGCKGQTGGIQNDGIDSAFHFYRHVLGHHNSILTSWRSK